MREIVAHTTRGLLRPRLIRVALVFNLLAAGFTAWLSQHPRYFGVAVTVAAYAALWTALAFVSVLRFHVFRQGAALIPGLRARMTVAALTIALVASAVPVIAALVTGQSPWTMIALVLVAFAIGWALGPVMPGNQKTALLGLTIGGALAMNVALYGQAFAERSNQSPWSWPDFADPVLQKWGLATLAMLILFTAVARSLRAREDALVVRAWWTRSQRDCGDEQCGATVPLFLLPWLPAFARRSLPTRDNGRTREDLLQRSLLRYSMSAVSPSGLAVVSLPFVLILTWLGLRTEGTQSLFWNPNLLLLNGLIVVFGSLTPARLQREMLRPASRHQLVTGLMRALQTDALIFASLLLAGTLALHFLVIREHMSTGYYWGGFLMSPGLIVFAYGVSMTVSRWTRRGSLVGFFSAWLVVVFASVRMENEATNHELEIWLGASVVVGLLGIGLLRLGRRLWVEADFA